MSDLLWAMWQLMSTSDESIAPKVKMKDSLLKWDTPFPTNELGAILPGSPCSLRLLRLDKVEREAEVPK